MLMTSYAAGASGDAARMRRLLKYWGVTVLLYVLCVGMLWGEVLSGMAPAMPALRLTIFAFFGHALFYLLIRLSTIWGLSAAWLSEYQGRFAIICAVTEYAIIGPLRGSTLLVLLVVLVFCSFTLKPQKAHALSVFAIILLGVTMTWMAFAHVPAFDAVTAAKQFVLVATMLVVVGILTGRLSELRSALKQQKAELAEALARIQELATRDDLTALPNRRHMTDLLQNQERKLAGNYAPTCIAVLDIDWFKKVNDTYGHATGDEVLRQVAQASRRALRPTDVLARWGGEEFLLFLVDTRLDAAQAIVERLKDQVRALEFVSEGKPFNISFSAGLVALQAGESVDAAIARADRLLYRAKSEGRNRVIAGDSPAVGPTEGATAPAYAGDAQNMGWQ